MILTLSHLTHRYGTQTVLSDLSLTLSSDTVYLLKAPSGCGKTTLLRLIAGLELPSEGTLTFSPSQGRVALMFQEDRLFPFLTATDNVTAPLPKGRQSAASALLYELGLDETAQKKKPPALSGGMNRRIALARTLLYASETACEILLLDEPFKGLDPAAKRTAIAVLSRYTPGRLTLIVSHEETEDVFPGCVPLTLPPVR